MTGKSVHSGAGIKPPFLKKDKPRAPFFTGLFLGPASGVAPKLLRGVNQVPIGNTPNVRLANFARRMAAEASQRGKWQPSKPSDPSRRRVFLNQAKKNTVVPGSVKNGSKKQ